MAQTRDWKGMKEMSACLLNERTGQDLEAWNQRIKAEGFTGEQTLRAWLTAQGLTGYAQSFPGDGALWLSSLLPRVHR